MHHCTISTLHCCTVSPFHRCTIAHCTILYTVAQLHNCTVSPLHCFTVALLHRCTVTPLHCFHRCAIAPFHCCTVAPLHCCTDSLLHHCTVAPFHPCTTALFHYCTVAPFHHCTPSQAHRHKHPVTSTPSQAPLHKYTITGRLCTSTHTRTHAHLWVASESGHLLISEERAGHLQHVLALLWRLLHLPCQQQARGRHHPAVELLKALQHEEAVEEDDACRVSVKVAENRVKG